MKIAIVGAGAVGGYYGGMLDKAGFDVTFIARGAHLEAMRKKGLEIISPAETFSVNATFTDDMNHLKQADLILFTVKSTETSEIAETIRPLLKEHAAVLTLQNGVDNEETLSEILGADRIVSGVTYVSANVEQPGVIRRAHPVDTVVIGALSDSGLEHVNAFSEILGQAGIDLKVSKKIMQRKWDKFLINAIYNPLSAAALATVGDILDKDPLRKTAEAVLSEVVNVGKALGIHFEDERLLQIFSVSEMARNHKTSMLQDREKGKQMEVESLCGYFSRKGKESEIPTPVIDTIYAILSSINEMNYLSTMKKPEYTQ